MPLTPLNISQDEYYSRLQIAADFVIHKLGRADVGIVLGSGLNDFANFLQNTKVVKYEEIPFMPITSVSGHAGNLLLGELPSNVRPAPLRVLCFAGRVHAYEGWRPAEVNFLCRLAALVGCSLYILTNSAGGAIKGMVPGSVMIITDHIRLTAVDALKDVCDDTRLSFAHGGRYLSAASSYHSSTLLSLAVNAAQKHGVGCHLGTYMWTGGPNYETPAEVLAGMKMGGGAFGMSTVPEVLASHAMGMQVFAMSLCTNLGAGLSDEVLTHEGVKEVASKAGPNFQKLLLEMFANLDTFGPSSTASAPTPVEALLSLPATSSYSIQPQHGWTPSPSQVRAAASVIASINMQQPPLTAAIIVPRSHAAAFLPSMTSVRSLMVSDLPVFHSIRGSPAVCSSRLFVGTVRSPSAVSSRIILLSLGTLESFNASESSLLIQAFGALGIRSLLHSFLSAPLPALGTTGTKIDESKSIYSLMLLQDVLDRTMETLPVPSNEFGTRHPSSLFSNDAIKAADEGLPMISSFLGALFTSAKGSYVAFPGPSLPSHAETRSAALGLSFMNPSTGSVGITNPAPLFAARALGFSIFGVAAIGNKLEDLPHWEQSHDPSAQTVASLLRRVLFHGKLSTPTPSTHDKHAITHLSDGSGPHAHIFHSEELKHADEGACDIAKALSLSTFNPRAVLFVDPRLGGIVGESSIKSTIAASTVPHFNDYANTAHLPHGKHWSERWILHSADYKGSHVIIVTAPSASDAGAVPVFHGIHYLLRVFRQLKLDNIITLSPVTSCSSSIALGDLFLTSDHINLTGASPLFGENENQWGPRFPDMSNAYNQQLRTAIINAAKNEKILLKEGVIAQTNNPASDSGAEGAFCSYLGASAYCSGLIPLNIIARHMNQRMISLAFVNRISPHLNAFNYQNEINASSNDISHLSSLIKAAITSF